MGMFLYVCVSFWPTAKPGHPAPTVTWFKEGKPLKSGRNVKIIQEGEDVILRIIGVSLLDAGEYTCTLNNSSGGTFAAVYLNVEGKGYQSGRLYHTY